MLEINSLMILKQLKTIVYTVTKRQIFQSQDGDALHALEIIILDGIGADHALNSSSLQMRLRPLLIMLLTL